MKKTLILLSFFITISFAKMNVVVSILPQKVFAEKIGGDRVNVVSMVSPGQDPHSYEPKPIQMKSISKADIYFSIGTEFETAWLSKFQAQNKSMLVVDSAKNIKKLQISKHHHKDEEHHDDENGLDPHIWTSPKNVKTIAKNIYEAYILKDKKNQKEYKNNYDKFLEEIDTTDKKIRDILKDVRKDSKFIVFHPSWGYFANEYNLVQLSIEIDGKKPKAKEIAMLIQEAREEGVKAIFAQPEFSDKSARVIAKELGIKVLKISPLSENWAENLVNMAEAIREE